jgi:MFS family permease
VTTFPSPAARRLRLVVLCASQFLLIMDFAIVNVALPSIQRSLGFSDADLAWVTSGYALTFGGFLLLAGRVADVTGRRRTYLVGISAFTAASAICGLAASPAMLLAGRAAQGVGAALTAASALALIATAFAPGRERTRALAAWGAMGGLGAGCGVVLGGALTQLAGWQAVFLLNLPVGILLVAGGVLALPADRPGRSGRFGVRQAVTATGGVGVLMLALTGAEDAWTSPDTLARFALAAALLALFAIGERRSEARLLPVGLLGRSAPVSIVALGIGTITAAYFFLSPYLQQGLGYGPLAAGLAYIVVPAGMVSGSAVAARLVCRVPAHVTVALGCGAMALGLIYLSRAPIPGTYLVDVLPGLALLGFGRGVSSPPHVSLALDRVEAKDAGAASGLMNTSIQVGAALGLSGCAVVASQASDHVLHEGGAADAALAAGTHVALAVLAVLAAVSGILAAVAMRPAPTSGTRRPARGLAVSRG